MLRPVKWYQIASTSVINKNDVEMKKWPIHAKKLGRIDLLAVEELDGGDCTKQEWAYERSWLSDETKYEAVPTTDASNTPRARYRATWIKRLLECGVIEATTKEKVRGHVKMFVVPEIVKQRFRSIKHTASINVHCGRETLRHCVFPSKIEVCEAVHAGDWFIALDFAAYYDQFELSHEVSNRMCFAHNGKLYKLRTLPMGQRHAVEIANAATQRVLDFPKKSNKTMSIIDNVIFVGDKEAVISDAYNFIQRCKAVNATLNEVDTTTATMNDVAALAQQSGDWAGVHFDLRTKSVKLTEKSVNKTKTSWSNQTLWSWRDYAAHMGLLFWAWRILDISVAEFFDVLRFNSQLGAFLTSRQPPQRADGSYPKNRWWDVPAQLPQHVLTVLAKWTQQVLLNERRVVQKKTTEDLWIEVDSSAIGYGYVSLNRNTQELFSWGAAWDGGDIRIHGGNLKKSTYSEPLGLRRCIRHALARNPGVRQIAVGTDNTVTEASYKRGFNSHSFHINRQVMLHEREFPSNTFRFRFVYVPGVEMLGDAPSRGQINCNVNRGQTIHMLRRHLGDNDAINAINVQR